MEYNVNCSWRFCLPILFFCHGASFENEALVTFVVRDVRDGHGYMIEGRRGWEMSIHMSFFCLCLNKLFYDFEDNVAGKKTPRWIALLVRL